MRDDAELISGALAGAAPLSTFGESVHPLRARALRTAESYSIVDFEQAQNYAPNHWDQPNITVFLPVHRERWLAHEAA